MSTPRALSRVGRKVATVIDVAPRSASGGATLDARVESVRLLRKERRDRARSIRRRGAAAIVAVAMTAAIAFFALRPRELSFSVDGSRGAVGQWVAPSASEDVVLQFSDGSRIALHASGRGRVAAVTTRGADFLLERGSLTAHVRHRDDTAWQITAGPFQVHVVGTAFEAEWDTSSESLTVTLLEGKVEITGACLSSPRPVRTGESVRLSCQGVVSAAATEPAMNLDPRAAPEPSVALTTPSEPAPVLATASAALLAVAPSASTSASADREQNATLRYRDLAKKGSYKEAYAAAVEGGAFDRLSSTPAAELLELANLARLAGQAEAAKRAYMAVRESAPGTDAAATAAFQLGRMTFGGAGAEGWFNVYLSERPAGPLAAEALGRVLELQARSKSPRAAETARAYLAKYPKGAHAALAESILGS
ncbi:MAG: FecR family protein [Polyangiaceae bacterium]